MEFCHLLNPARCSPHLLYSFVSRSVRFEAYHNFGFSLVPTVFLPRRCIDIAASEIYVRRGGVLTERRCVDRYILRQSCQEVIFPPQRDHRRSALVRHHRCVRARVSNILACRSSAYATSTFYAEICNSKFIYSRVSAFLSRAVLIRFVSWIVHLLIVYDVQQSTRKAKSILKRMDIPSHWFIHVDSSTLVNMETAHEHRG